MPGYPAQDYQPGQVSIKASFLTNGTSSPTTQYGVAFTVTRTGVGAFRVTFTNPPEYFAQYDMIQCDVTGTSVAGYTVKAVAEELGGTAANPAAYIDIQVYDGANAAVETTGKRVSIDVAARKYSMAVPT